MRDIFTECFIFVILAAVLTCHGQQQPPLIAKLWSLDVAESAESGMGVAESPFRPFHTKPKLLTIDGAPVAFACSSAYEAVAVDLLDGKIRWRRYLDIANRSSPFVGKCRAGFCSGVDVYVDPIKYSLLRNRNNQPSADHQDDSNDKISCDMLVFAIAPGAVMLTLDARTGSDCQTPVPVTVGDEDASSGYGVSIPPLVIKDSVVVAMDTPRASNIRGGYIETRSVANTSIIQLRKRFGSAFKAPLVYSEQLDLLFAIISPANSPYAPSAEDRFANHVLALRLADLTIMWSYKFLSHDDFVFDYRHPPELVDMLDSAGRKISSLFITTPFGNVYWLDAATGYERQPTFQRPISFERTAAGGSNTESSYEQRRENNWARVSSGAFGNIFSDAIPSDDTNFNRFPNLELPDEGVLRLAPPGLVNGGLVVDAQRKVAYVSFVQSLFFLESASADTFDCSAASQHLAGCQIPKPLGLAACPLSCEASFATASSDGVNAGGHQWCANVSESGLTAIFLGNSSVAWSFALTPTFFPINSMINIPQLLNIRAFDVLLVPPPPGYSWFGHTVWLIDPFTRGINVARADDGEIALESDQLLHDDVVHWAKMLALDEQMRPGDQLPHHLRNTILVVSEGHSWPSSSDKQKHKTSFRMSLLRIGKVTSSSSSQERTSSSASPVIFVVFIFLCTVLLINLLLVNVNLSYRAVFF